MPPKKKTPFKILVAVDFGTTFSSMAWATSTNPGERQVLEWWGNPALSGPNVPTKLQYRGGVARGQKPDRWGLQVDPDDPTLGIVYEWFKMQLYSHSRDKDTELVRKYPLRSRIVNDDECRQLVIDYLSAMRANFMAWIPRMFGSIGVPPVEYIITVPAIWTDTSKDMTRACALEAGMGSRDGNIEMIREPEAAGLHALQSGIDFTLRVGETFVLCDAGGGGTKLTGSPFRTADLISYKVERLEPRSLVETAPGSGGLCGSTFLNRAFEAWLDRKFNAMVEYDKGLKRHIMGEFETKIKRRFKGASGGPYGCNVFGLRDNATIGVQNGRLTIPVDDLRTIFKEVTDKVVDLVLEQIRATLPAQVDTVVLAGGFGENEYLSIELKRAMRDASMNIAIKQVMNSDTAVVRGALLRAVNRTDSSIPIARTEGRIAAKSYGIGKFVPFDEHAGHDRSKSEWDPFEQHYRIQIIDWFIGYGTRCDENKPKLVKLYSRRPRDGRPLEAMKIVVYIHEESKDRPPPKHATRGVESILEVTARLDLIPIANLRPCTGRDSVQYVGADFDLETTLDSANMLRFVVKHEGQSYGTATVRAAFRTSS